MDVELLVDAQCSLGEGPCWDPRSASVLWVDIERAQLHALALDTGQRTTRTLDQAITALAPRASGGFVVAVRDGLALLDDVGAQPRVLADLEGARADARMNDGACDPFGRFWAGSMATDGRPDAGSLYRLDVDGTVTTVLRGLSISNGLGWSPDGQIMYVSDSGRGEVKAYDIDGAAGTLRERGIVLRGADRTGVADGLAIDVDGRLWTARWGGAAVLCHTPDGRLQERLALPCTNVTSCCFGGTDLDVLYITTAAGEPHADEPVAGGLFACRPGVAGLPAGAYAG